MQETFITLIEEYGYLGISLLIFVENIFPPIPSEGILLFGGYASHKTEINIWGVILSATIGSMAGACVLYYIGYIFGKDRLKKLVSGKIGKTLHFSPDGIDKADKWFCRFGGRAVLVCRCIPVVRSLVSIPAGISKMNFGMFFLLTLAGSLTWNTLIVWLGYFASDAWQSVQSWLGIYSDVVLILIIIAVIAAFIVLQVRRKQKYTDESEVSSK